MADQLGDAKNQFAAMLDRASSYNPRKLEKQLEEIPLLDDLQEKSGLPRTVIVGGIVGGSLILTLISFNVSFLGVFMSNLIGYAYPTYMSLRAVESPRTDDDTAWLTYWVVFASFFILEMFILKSASEIAIGVRPYFILKVLILSWCQFGNGAAIIYESVLKPLVAHADDMKGQLDARLSQYEVEQPSSKSSGRLSRLGFTD